jgi:hypothetical protein
MPKKENKNSTALPRESGEEQIENSSKFENQPEREITINFRGYLADRLNWDLEQLELLMDTLEVRSSLVISDSAHVSTAENFTETAGAIMFMSGYAEMLDYVSEDETISIRMKNWQELECRINDLKLYEKALNTELKNPNKVLSLIQNQGMWNY